MCVAAVCSELSAIPGCVQVPESRSRPGSGAVWAPCAGCSGLLWSVSPAVTDPTPGGSQALIHPSRSPGPGPGRRLLWAVHYLSSGRDACRVAYGPSMLLSQRCLGDWALPIPTAKHGVGRDSTCSRQAPGQDQAPLKMRRAKAPVPGRCRGPQQARNREGQQGPGGGGRPGHTVPMHTHGTRAHAECLSHTYTVHTHTQYSCAQGTCHTHTQYPRTHTILMYTHSTHHLNTVCYLPLTVFMHMYIVLRNTEYSCP